MAKKLGSFRILSYTLSVLATVVFIVACGDGVPDILADFRQNVDVSENEMRDKIGDVMEKQPEPPQPPPPLSSNVGGEESSDSGSGDKSSSSNWEQPSSTSPGVSSQSNAESSNSAEPSKYTLECNILPANSTFPSGTKILEEKRPEVKCKVIESGAVITLDEKVDVFSWTNDPPWYAPYVGTYDNILVKISRSGGTKECNNMEVKCNGTITITGPSSSSRPPTPSSNSTPSSSSRSSSSSVASSSSRAASSSSAAQNGSGDYCYYGEGNCHKMPTGDNCASGVLVTSCSNPTVKYCDYGVCTNGNKWDCASGGCYIKPSGGCGGSGFTEVTTCPSDHLPPCGKNPDGAGCKD
ncbi:MAG: hypothetical protein LBC87_07690 [Fibromonadaceae bacterium]|nr:hypothetical protein [Fibromonadaceae bacterium]